METMTMVLIKFNTKRDVRFFLRHNALQKNKKSSLYKIKNGYHPEFELEQNTESYYLLVDLTSNFAVESENKLIQTPNIETINEKTEVEVLLFAWAVSEIKNDVKFIAYETKSSAKVNEINLNHAQASVEDLNLLDEENYHGRVIRAGDVEVIRLFEPLFDVMAIFNYTTNSFSDGGVYNSPEKLKHRIVQQLRYGATIIDVGVESTRPNIQLLSSAEEISSWQEILPTVMQLKKEYKIILSIDTYHNETVLWLLENGIDFDIINDVSGNIELSIVKKLLALNKKYIAMHNLGIPHNANNIIPLEQNPIEVINAFFKRKKYEFLQAGIDEKEIIDNIIFDPGIGFGNNAAGAWYIIKNLDKIDTLGSEFLLGHSRKSFMNHISAKPYKERDIETAIIALQVAKHIDYVRIHDTISLGKLQSAKL